MHLLRSTISYHLQADLFLAPQIHGAINRFSVDMVLLVFKISCAGCKIEFTSLIALQSFVNDKVLLHFVLLRLSLVQYFLRAESIGLQFAPSLVIFHIITF